MKISVVLLVLLATVVYTLNDYFQNEKWHAMQTQLRQKTVQIKTTVSSQLSQVRNTLSAYEGELSESGINWVQLDPFFAIARLEGSSGSAHVAQMVVRSNTPAERWNAGYLEKAMAVNPTQSPAAIVAQLFQDRQGAKFLILRFRVNPVKEIAVATSADYFQKYFDLNRGEKSTSFLATAEGLLAGHSEGDYIASSTQETSLPKKRYLFEKEEIAGTNLIAVNYVLRRKIADGLTIPWSIIGVIAGFGCILLAVIFYNLDPIERKVARYKKQEREQIYKDTIGQMQTPAKVNLNTAVALPKTAPLPKAEPEVKPVKKEVPVEVVKVQPVPPVPVQAAPEVEEVTQKTEIPPIDEMFAVEDEKTARTDVGAAEFLALDDKIDMQDIEKALALDDFDNEELTMKTASADLLEKNLTPQKVSISSTGSVISKPDFVLKRKDFEVDEFKTNIRRPEKS